MRKRYGLPYKGSKNRIAEWMLRYLPDTPVFVDLMAGGCAVTHVILENRDCDIVCNDISYSVVLFEQAIKGEFENEKRWISRERFEELKNQSLYVKYCWSFNNGGTTYMYATEIEPWKCALWYARVSKDYSKFEEFGIHTDGTSRDIKANKTEYLFKYSKWYMKKNFNYDLTEEQFTQDLKRSLKEEREKLQDYMFEAFTKSGLTHKQIDHYLGTTGMSRHYFTKPQWAFPTREAYNKMNQLLHFSKKYDEIIGVTKILQSLQSLESMESLESLQRLERLRSLEILRNSRINYSFKDFTKVEVENATYYYIDPPYKETAGYNGADFDYERFEDWLAIVNKPCIISESTCPKGCVLIATTEARNLNSKGATTSKRAENLYIQERFKDWYYEEMAKRKPGGIE